jgi:hypothetical protein
MSPHDGSAPTVVLSAEPLRWALLRPRAPRVVPPSGPASCPRRRPIQSHASRIRHCRPFRLPEGQCVPPTPSWPPPSAHSVPCDATPTSNLAHAHGPQITLSRTLLSTHPHGHRPGSSTAPHPSPSFFFYVMQHRCRWFLRQRVRSFHSI